MKKIKLSINSPKKGLLRQTPNNDGIWGDYKFFINDPVEECDYWVICSKGEKQNNKTKVSKDNLVLLTGEPESVYHYAPGFIKNFGRILTFRKDIKHPNVINNIQPAQPWWLGRKMLENGLIEFSSDYDELSKPVKDKKKLISVITSSKAFTQGHKDRINFVKKLKDYFGDQLDVFGKGINSFEDKWETLREYKYHIVIENSSCDDNWTEKLADNYLAECFPFYHGCKNLNKYFNDNAFKLIDINNFDASVKIIEEGIANNLYVESYSAITKAKRKVMEEYNIFPMLINELTKINGQSDKEIVRMKHEQSYFDIYKIWLIIKRFYTNKFK